MTAIEKDLSPDAEWWVSRAGDTWEVRMLFMRKITYLPKQLERSNLSEFHENLKFALQLEGTKMSMDHSGIQIWCEYIQRPANRCYRVLEMLELCLLTEVLSKISVLTLFLSLEGRSCLSLGDLPESHCSAQEIIILMMMLTTKQKQLTLLGSLPNTTMTRTYYYPHFRQEKMASPEIICQHHTKRQ